MQKIFEKCLRHRKLVIAAFGILTALSVLCIPQVHVNSDLSDYLPDDSASTISLDVMDDVFGDDMANLRLYVQGVSLTDARDLADSLESGSGAENIEWLGDHADIHEPLAMQDSDTVSKWCRDGGYLYTAHIPAGHETEMVPEIREIAEAAPGATRVAIDGAAAETDYSSQATHTDLSKIMLVAIAIVIIVMMLITVSYAEPFIMLLVIGIAIVLNMGTNVIQGEISSITQLVAAVLQLAVSMDYAIVLSTSYHRFKRECSSSQEAMLRAMTHSHVVILSSAAVTFFGFATLCLMKYKIGMDLGIVLAKGVVFSFLSIMLLMPCVMLACDRLLEKTSHRRLVPGMGAWAGICRKVALPVFLVVIVVVVPAYLGKSAAEFTYGASTSAKAGTQLAEDGSLLRDVFGESQSWAILVPEGRWADEAALVDDLESLGTTASVVSYGKTVNAQIPYQLGDEADVSQLISGGYSRIVLTSDVSEESDEAFALVDTARGLCSSHYGDSYYLAGKTVTLSDVADVSKGDEALIQIASIVAIGIVLLIMFRSLSIPFILLFTIEVSIWINLAVPYFLGQSTSFIGYLVIDAVQLGAAVDYSIIYAHEYLKQRAVLPKYEAAAAALKHASVPILASASILMLSSVGIYLLSSNAIISELGMLIGRGALIATAMIFLFLPTLFVGGDWIVRHTSVGLEFARKEDKENTYRPIPAKADEI